MFTVDPNDLKDLDGLQLVELLRVLLHAEARKSGIPMRNVDVPLQITVADGGQDATVKWEKGKPSTDYFPAREVVFQCKAKDGGDAGWKKEVWTKASQRKKQKVINPAVQAMMDRGGAYVGVTSTALVGTKAGDRVKAIKDGITKAGGDPAKLSSIQVYDGNKLSAWASEHPAVALWVFERKAGFPLSSFATLNQWGKRSEITTPPYVPSEDRRFALSAVGPKDALSFDQLAARVVDHLSDAGATVRIWGASGLGKTRALYEALRSSSSELRGLTEASFIFCDYREVISDIWTIANQIKNSGQAAVLVVDSCAWEDAKKLNEFAFAEGSQLRVITLGSDGVDQAEDCLMIRPLPADRTTIKGILKQNLGRLRDEQIDFIATQCDGFPRIAVLASKAFRGSVSPRKSANDVAEQILKTAGIERETVRALELLSLFDHLDPDQNPRDFDSASETLVHLKGELVYENLVRAAEQHLVERSHGRMKVQPLPIANHLALRRLNYLRPSTIIDFLTSASTQKRDAMLMRWSEFPERSRTLIEVVRNIVDRGWLRDGDAILRPEAEPYLVAFVHADPETLMRALSYPIHQKSLDTLAAHSISQTLLDALRLLATRSDTFRPTAALVIRLAAASDFEESSPVMQLLRQLYQVALAGTEADDRRKRDSIIEALEVDDHRVKKAVTEALGAMLTTHITRSGEFDQIAGEDYRNEWSPESNETVVEYFRWALSRLHELWSEHGDLRDRIEAIVADHLRSLIDFDLLEPVIAFVRDVVSLHGHWARATKGIGDWLYFDAPEEENRTSQSMRSLYEATLPTDEVDLAVLYSRFWGGDLRDPAKRYSRDSDDRDFEYSARQAKALASRIVDAPSLLDRAISRFVEDDLNTPWPFAQELAEKSADPIELFRDAVAKLDANGSRTGVPFVRALLAGMDRRLLGEEGQSEKLIAIAEASPILSERPMDIYGSLLMNAERISKIAQDVRDGRIGSLDTVPISYGRGLEHVATGDLVPLIDALIECTEDGGAWAAIEILTMVTHGQSTVSPDLANLCSKALLAPGIIDGPTLRGATAEHSFTGLMKKLGASQAIDGEFSLAFGQLIERACRSVGGRHDRPIDILRTGLEIVVEHSPVEVWSALAGFYEVATSSERDRLSEVTSATKRFSFRNVDRATAGALFKTPRDTMSGWVASDPEGRIGFLIGFYPILERTGDVWAWHPSIQDLADRYGEVKAFRSGLRSRILPRTYGGSIGEHLARFRDPLELWEKHPKLGSMATLLLSDLDAWID